MHQNKIKKKSLQIVHINYDWRDIYRTDPEGLLAKLHRDQLAPETNIFFAFSWSTDSYEKAINKNIYTVHKRARFRHMRPLYDILLWWQLPKILQTHKVKPDCFLVHDVGTYLATLRARKLFNVPSLLYLSNIPSTLMKTRKYAWIRSIYQRTVELLVRGKIDYVFAISNAVASYAVKLGVEEKNIHFFAPQTIPEDVDEKLKKTKGSVRKKYCIPADSLVVLTVGRLEPEKRIDSILRGFASLPQKDKKLIIVGDGVLSEKLKKEAEVLGIQNNVIFTGNVPHDEIWGYYADSSVFVMQSSSESLGLVVWEAMISEIPVITSRAEGFLESIGSNEERGYIWEESDGLENLHEIIHKCKTQDAEIETKLLQAKKYVREKINDTYSINDLAEEFI